VPIGGKGGSKAHLTKGEPNGCRKGRVGEIGVTPHVKRRGMLTIGVDLGDRCSFYCVLDEAGKIILGQKVPTTPEAMKLGYS